MSGQNAQRSIAERYLHTKQPLFFKDKIQFQNSLPFKGNQMSGQNARRSIAERRAAHETAFKDKIEFKNFKNLKDVS